MTLIILTIAMIVILSLTKIIVIVNHNKMIK